MKKKITVELDEKLKKRFVAKCKKENIPLTQKLIALIKQDLKG